MSTHIITVEANQLRALLLVAAKKDVRFYLNAICFDVENRALVATDGHSLMAIKVAFEQTSLPVKNFIISRADCDRAIKATSKHASGISVHLTDLPGSLRTFELQTQEGAVIVREQEGRYADWRRVVPTTISGEIAKFNPEYVATMAKAFAIAQGKRQEFPYLAMNGDSSALVTCEESNLLGVIMPLRENASMESQWKHINATLGNFQLYDYATSKKAA